MDLGWRLAERVSEEKSLEETVVELLAKNRLSVTTAESCTGGLIAGTIVNVAGASDVLNEGYVTYSNEAKERLVGVRHETLERFGAVSEETAREMAEGSITAECVRGEENFNQESIGAMMLGISAGRPAACVSADGEDAGAAFQESGGVNGEK